MATRGSAKLLQEKAIPKKELEQLWKLLDEDDQVEVLSWEPRGNPAVTRISGTVRVQPEAAGALLDRLLKLPGGPLGKVHVFPLGISEPPEVLFRFGPGDARV
jgi:hypothetical protein